jgi:uncharacterized membrane protein
LVGVLLFASPAISGAIHLPAGEAFSELYLLGPQGMAQDYPTNIAVDQNYSVYVDVGNHLGASASYVLYVKLAIRLSNYLTQTLEPKPRYATIRISFNLQDSTVYQQLLSFTVIDATTTQPTHKSTPYK